MTNKKLTLSIVIPVCNEEHYLPACLESIAAQSVRPDQVIVVDNNSTDATVAIAESYDFVTLLHEPRQHQSFAQKTGFNAVRSDIIGRIDGDSVLPADWVQKVKRHFASDPGLIALTGGTTPYDMVIKRAGSVGFQIYIDLASKIAGHRMLWGANCALRRRAWQRVKDMPMTRADIWEDYDLAFCLAPLGRIEVFNNIDVDSSFRSVQRPLLTQTRYQFRAIRTFFKRSSLVKTALMLCLWSTMYLLFIPIMLDRYALNPIIRLAQFAKRAVVVPLEAE